MQLRHTHKHRHTKIHTQNIPYFKLVHWLLKVIYIAIHSIFLLFKGWNSSSFTMLHIFIEIFSTVCLLFSMYLDRNTNLSMSKKHSNVLVYIYMNGIFWNLLCLYFDLRYSSYVLVMPCYLQHSNIVSCDRFFLRDWKLLLAQFIIKTLIPP